MPENKDSSSSLWLTLSVFFVIAVMALYVVEEFTDYSVLSPSSGGGSGLGGSAEGSLQPAVDACKRAASAQLGSSLVSSRMDKISTRYLPASQEYFVILDLVIRDQERVAYYYECNVTAVNQQVIRTRVTGPPGSFESIGIE